MTEQIDDKNQQLARVSLSIGDPWDLVTEIGSGPFIADVLQTNLSSGREWLLRFSKPVDFRGNTYTHLVIFPRTAAGLKGAFEGDEVYVSATLLRQDQLKNDALLASIPERIDFIGSMRVARHD